jgi:membrane protease YdiL (CAAX protease family)
MLRPFRRWPGYGNLNASTLILMLVTVFISSSALVIWYTVAKPDLSVWMNAIPRTGTVWLALLGLGFALVNAAAEEFLFRGILFAHVIADLVIFVLLFQAVAHNGS